ncbi:MAG: hypothetical protein VKN72_12790 [Nostocales cyanobacterium 94392]|nr:hypothetical protein [Nostocales cyanobacterium 94392]
MEKNYRSGIDRGIFLGLTTTGWDGFSMQLSSSQTPHIPMPRYTS